MGPEASVPDGSEGRPGDSSDFGASGPSIAMAEATGRLGRSPGDRGPRNPAATRQLPTPCPPLRAPIIAMGQGPSDVDGHNNEQRETGAPSPRAGGPEILEFTEQTATRASGEGGEGPKFIPMTTFFQAGGRCHGEGRHDSARLSLRIPSRACRGQKSEARSWERPGVWRRPQSAGQKTQ